MKTYTIWAVLEVEAESEEDAQDKIIALVLTTDWADIIIDSVEADEEE